MDAGAADRITDDAAVRRAGSSSARFTVRDGDGSPLTSTENPRAQLNKDGLFCEGAERWIGWSMLFPQDYPNIPSGGWAVHGSVANAPPYGGKISSFIWEVDHASYGSRLHAQSATGTVFYDEPMQRGAWTDWTLHFKFSQDPSVGYLEMYRNGQLVTLKNGQTRWYYSTLSPDREPGSCGNLQVTNYRGRGQASVQTVYHDEIKVGTGYGAVAPS